MDTREIRDRFLAFFEREGHERVPSSSLIPDDPSLLLTNAGMNQFKPYFLGQQTPPFERAMSVQKCFRTVDIDEVGDASHLTFFEMLGNFSFGDYYKEKACPFAWEMVTEEWGLDPDRLWVTIYETDDEARDVWVDIVGVDPKRIVRLGKGPNFWSMGVAGPCGPCSEIFFDLGDAFGAPSDQGPAGNEQRYLEIWNLVFMQSDCNADIEPIADLPKKNIDTGAGLERLALVMQNKSSLYETDTLRSLIATAEDLTKMAYEKDERTDRGLRILADHGRGMTFLLADGVLPSNEGRGYVLRRIMRRAVRQARLLGRDQPVLPELARATRDLMGDAYPEIKERFGIIEEIAAREEERFDETLKQGLSLLEEEISAAKLAGSEGLSGHVAFKLHDTFGFPIDITNDVAREAGLEVDAGEFDTLMEQQRTRARSARKRSASGAPIGEASSLVERYVATEFIGYEYLKTTASLVGVPGLENAILTEGDEADVVLDRTVFYAEGGGQVGDRGTLTGPSGKAQVLDTPRIAPGITEHRIRVYAGEFQIGEEMTAEV
ncbi:MAG: alanine--tRNA ligase, partial [Actinomycetota bacterium]